MSRWIRRKGRPRRTGPSTETREAVFRRDGDRCVRCGMFVRTWGASIQHRKPRGMGGTKDPSINSAANLIVLCGDGVRGCHGWVESHRDEAHAAGWSLPWWEDPTAVPVTYWDGRKYTLSSEGDRNAVHADADGPVVGQATLAVDA